MPINLSMLAMCNLSKPWVMDAFLALREDPFQRYAFGSFHPAYSRREHSLGKTSPLFYNDYKNAATLRELTRGEG